MRNLPYSHLGKRGHTDWPSLEFSETADEVSIRPARYPIARLVFTCGIIIGMMYGMEAIGLMLRWGKMPGAIIFGHVIAGPILLFVSIHYWLEKKRGPVFLLDWRTDRYSFPRKGVAGDRAELAEVALVEATTEVDGSRLYELQLLLLRRGDAPPEAMLLMGC